MPATEAAAFWLVHRDRDTPEPGMPGEESEFQSWLEASIRNRTAYERARDIWQDFDAMDPGERRELRKAAMASISRPRRWRGLAAVGALCLAGLAALFWITDRLTVSIGRRPAHIATVHHERARLEPSSITLADGTVASRDADSAVDVDY